MKILILFCLIVFNGYFSLAEMALVSVTENDLMDEENKNNPRAFRVQKLIEKPEEFLSTIQVGSTIISFLEGIYGGDYIGNLLEPVLIRTNLPVMIVHNICLVIGIAFITYFSIIISELVPKFIAINIPLRVSLTVAPSLNFFLDLSYPFIKLLTWSTALILRLLHINGNRKKITEKDLKGFLSSAYKQGTLERQQLWLHENVFTFKTLTARRIMKPAKIVACIDYNWGAGKVEKLIRSRPYSHYPVYKENPDLIIGILSMKMFFLHSSLSWQETMLPPANIHPDMPARDIFDYFKERKINFGLVTGGDKKFVGALAMLDIMEGVFGDVPEPETYAVYFYQKSPKVWIAEGFIHLQRIRQTLSLPWIRSYESKYLSISELIAGESAETFKQPLILKDVSFTVIEGTVHHPLKIMITLP